MALVNDIKERLGQHLAGTSTLLEFQQWLDCQDLTSNQARKLREAIEWEFCDFERGLLTENTLKARLHDLVSGRPEIAQVFVMGVPQQAPVLQSCESYGYLIEESNFYQLVTT